MLRSFNIEGFRAFRRLQVPKLGRVNLIVGKNNVGKTMLLEALRLYAVGGNPMAIRKLLMERDEVYFRPSNSGISQGEPLLRAARIFHQPTSPHDAAKREIRLSENDLPTASVTVAPVVIPRAIGVASSFRPTENSSPDGGGIDVPALKIDARGRSYDLPIASLSDDREMFLYDCTFHDVGLHVGFVPAGGIDERELSRDWDSIVAAG
ncbi:MAG: AAA family ATPase, partial [Planctomycetia bacterium]